MYISGKLFFPPDEIHISHSAGTVLYLMTTYSVRPTTGCGLTLMDRIFLEVFEGGILIVLVRGIVQG